MHTAECAREHARTGQRIAIIGIGCRYPGGVTTPETFWKLLANGVDAISEVPSDRWNVDEYYDARRKVPGRMRTRWAGSWRT
jgi:acyl transferase domain-containing protein